MEGVRKLGWAVKSRGADGDVIRMSYTLHSSPEEAIHAYEVATGKSWAEHVAEGATLVQQEMVEFQGPRPRRQ